MFVAVHCDQTVLTCCCAVVAGCTANRGFCASGPELGDIMDINESLF